MTFHPDSNLPGCMMPDGGECCAGYQALLADWRRLRTQAARASNLQPMSTAPMDGREILGYWSGGKTWDIVYCSNLNEKWCNEGGELITPPTHWHPLPDDAAQSAWQPIETAPHQEYVLLGWLYDGIWETDVGTATSGWRRGGISTMSQHGQATHWMPLPEPPALAMSPTEGNTP
jgi:hypothetical protein